MTKEEGTATEVGGTTTTTMEGEGEGHNGREDRRWGGKRGRSRDLRGLQTRENEESGVASGAVAVVLACRRKRKKGRG